MASLLGLFVPNRERLLRSFGKVKKLHGMDGTRTGIMLEVLHEGPQDLSNRSKWPPTRARKPEGVVLRAGA